MQRNIKVVVSYLEIYNENVNDLLDSSKRNLDVRDGKDGVVVERLTFRQVQSTAQMLEILEEGDRIRMIADTKMNSKSTRSHTVFRINIVIDDHNEQTGRHTIRSS